MSLRNDKKIYYSADAMASLFSISARRIQQLAKENVIPKAEKGKYEFIGAVKGYTSYLQELATGKTRATEDMQIHRARLLRAKADIAELEVSILENQLIPANRVENVWSRMVGAFRARMLSIPNRLGAQVITLKEYNDVETLIRETIYEALTELAEYDPGQYDDREDSGKSSKAKRATSRSKSK